MGLGDMFGGLGDMFGGLGEKLGGFGEIRDAEARINTFEELLTVLD